MNTENQLERKENNAKKGICSDIWMLVWKNWIVAKRNKYSSLFQILSPLAIFLLALFFQYVANNLNAPPLKEGPITKLEKLTKSPNYASIGYGILGNMTDWANYTIH